MASTMNVVALFVAMILAGCMAQNDPVEEALAIANKVTEEVQGSSLVQDDPKEEQKPSTEAQVAADAKNAHRAAKTAKQAAKVANKVAKHSIRINEHAKSALKNAHDALHRARVDTEGLSSDQKNSLKDAEKKLREATKDAEYGQVKDGKYVKAEVDNKQLEDLEKKMEKKKADEKEKQKKEKKEKKGKKDEKDDQDGNNDEELEAMRKELEALRKKLKEKGDKSDDEDLKDLQKQIEEMEKAEKKEDKADAKSHDEMKAEIERLREMIKDLEEQEDDKKDENEETKDKKVKKGKKAKTHPLPDDGDADGPDRSPKQAVRVEKSLDVDTAMPYGDLEPFGREDTAQELTENSIHESDEMVDQLERAEVAEEKRSVFRALTRLRGAAITSFDGVARSQTGNIDEYNKIHQWRDAHPLHHLADEESDVSKWAFPDNAD